MLFGERSFLQHLFSSSTTKARKPPHPWMVQALATSCWLWSGLSGVSTTTAATPPCVSFDVSDIVEARDVTTPDFAQINPDEKLLELRFQISALIRYGHGDDLFQFLYVIDSPTRSVRIVDCFPKTELTTELTGPIQVEQHRENNNSWEARANAAWPTIGEATANYQRGDRQDAKYRFEVLPPQELIAASGTTQRGAGAYFKLIPSARSTLDGTKEFGLVLRAPRTWRADYLHVRCVAYGGARQTNFENAQPVCGGAGFVVAMHLSGDGTARQSALDFIAREQQLRQTAQQYRKEITERQYPSFGDKVGALFSVGDPKIPNRWLDDVVSNPHDAAIQSYQHRLPQPVNSAVQNYLASRQHLRQLPPARYPSQPAPPLASNAHQQRSDPATTNSLSPFREVGHEPSASTLNIAP